MWRVLAITMALAGCATSTPMNDGQVLIECDGASVKWSVCFKEANRLCPNGYELISQNTEQGPISGAAAHDVAILSAAERKNIVVRCK